MSIAIGRDSGDLGDFGGGGDGFSLCREEFDDAVDGCLRASTEVHGVAACSYVFDTFRVDGASEDGSGRGTISSNFVCLLSDVLNETKGFIVGILVSERERERQRQETIETYRAPRFSNLSLRVMDLATVTPSKKNERSVEERNV